MKPVSNASCSFVMPLQGKLRRKQYELAHVVRTLDKLGALKPTATGLAIAAGHETVHYHLSNRVAKIYAR